MKIVQEVSLISHGSFDKSQDWITIQQEIRHAIALIVWPTGASNFTINPTRHGNGVKPLKNACVVALKENFGWHYFDVWRAVDITEGFLAILSIKGLLIIDTKW